MFKRVLSDMYLQFKSILGRISAITHMHSIVGVIILVASIRRCFTNDSGLIGGGDRVGGTNTNIFT